MYHTLSYDEINNLRSGRILNTLVMEYVFREHPTRWSNGQQKELPCHWFEEHPRQNAYDDGGYCSADSIMPLSKDLNIAMITIPKATRLLGKSLQTYTQISCGDGFNDPFEIYWATFEDRPWGSPGYQGCWMQGTTLAEAICKAALLSC